MTATSPDQPLRFSSNTARLPIANAIISLLNEQHHESIHGFTPLAARGVRQRCRKEARLA